MRLQDALEIGLECGLTDIGEAIYNIKVHSGNIFNYNEEVKEYKELIDECKKHNLTSEMLIEDVLKLIKFKEI